MTDYHDSDKEPRVRFRRGTAPRGKFGSTVHIILIGAAMAVIVWLIFYLKDSSLFSSDEPAAGTAPVVHGSGLDINENLINYFDEGIQLLRPDTNWSFSYGVDLGRGNRVDDFTDEMWLRATEIARLTLFDSERPVVTVRVGKLQLTESRTSNSLAQQSFQDIMLYALNPEHPFNVDTVVPTESIDSGAMQGTYYVLNVVHSDNTQSDMRVVSFYVKNDFAYILLGEVSYEEYDTYRERIRSIFEHFVFI